MNFINFTTIIINYIKTHQEWIIGIISAIIGSILTLVITIVWDNHKDNTRYKSLLKVLLYEIKENQNRANLAIEKLPLEIQKKIEEGDINEGVFIPEEEISKMSWSFSKPYAVDAWKTFISSGFTPKMSSELFQKMYKIYDSINSINFIANLSLNIFQILSQPNKLDEKTNKSFDQFCKFGTHSLEVLLSKNIKQISGDLEKIIQ